MINATIKIIAVDKEIIPNVEGELISPKPNKTKEANIILNATPLEPNGIVINAKVKRIKPAKNKAVPFPKKSESFS